MNNGGQILERGLNAAQVVASRRLNGANSLDLHRTSVWSVLIRQLNNPLLLILILTVAVSYSFGDRIDAAIIFAIMSLSVGLGFFNEYSSERTVEDLLS